jgi:hypothetical protein
MPTLTYFSMGGRGNSQGIERWSGGQGEVGAGGRKKSVGDHDADIG